MCQALKREDATSTLGALVMSMVAGVKVTVSVRADQRMLARTSFGAVIQVAGWGTLLLSGLVVVSSAALRDPATAGNTS